MFRKMSLLSVVALIAVLQQSALTSDAHGACTTVTLNYEPSSTFPVWVIYTPCGTPNSQGSTLKIWKNSNSTFDIERGSYLRITRDPTGRIPYIARKVNTPTFTVLCGESMTNPWCNPQ